VAKVRTKKPADAAPAPQVAMMGTVPMDIAIAALAGDHAAMESAKTFMRPVDPQPERSSFAKQVEALGVTFHEVPTPRVEVLETVDGRARDAFEKIAPRLLASARETFDGPAAMKAARDAGAIGVVLAPVVLREIQQAEPEKRGITAREAVTRWFDAQKGMSGEDREDAETAVHRFLDAEGM
jgi:hypothetical protein